MQIRQIRLMMKMLIVRARNDDVWYFRHIFFIIIRMCAIKKYN